MKNKCLMILLLLTLLSGLTLCGCQDRSVPESQTDNAAIMNAFNPESQEVPEDQEASEREDGTYIYHEESEITALGLVFSLKNISPAGATLVFHQYDPDAPTGELSFGDEFELEVQNGGKWERVPDILGGEYAFNAIAYIIAAGQSSEVDLSWEWLYGKLPAGEYRIKKEIHNFRGTGDYDKYIVYAHFILAGSE